MVLLLEVENSNTWSTKCFAFCHDTESWHNRHGTNHPLCKVFCGTHPVEYHLQSPSNINTDIFYNWVNVRTSIIMNPFVSYVKWINQLRMDLVHGCPWCRGYVQLGRAFGKISGWSAADPAGLPKMFMDIGGFSSHRDTQLWLIMVNSRWNHQQSWINN